MYMLDTTICIFIMKQQKDVLARLQRCATSDVAISAISVGELRYGAARSAKVEDNQAALDDALIPFQILEFDERAAYFYGDIRAHLRRQGTLIGPLDMLIGAHAFSVEAILVSNNLREFGRIPGLAVEDWTI